MKTIKNINLLTKERRQVGNILRIGSIFQKASIIALVLFLVIYSLTFLYISYQSIKYRDSQAKISALTTSVNGKRDLEALLSATAVKLKAIDGIISSQFNYPLIFQELFSLPISGVSIGSFAIDTDGLVNLNTVASSSAILDNFVGVISRKDTVDKKYKNIKTSTISLDKNGHYVLSFTFNLPKDKYHD